jgi:hypothetical protein
MYFEVNDIKEYPAHIVGPFNAYEQANDEGAMHKSLLDLGESLLTYIVGIMFGEYKKSGKISEILETELYKYTSYVISASPDSIISHLCIRKF